MVTQKSVHENSACPMIPISGFECRTCGNVDN